jgi:cytochrome b involved in lipid metabolism
MKIIKIIFGLVLVLVVIGGVFFYIESGEENELNNFANSIQQDPNAATRNITLAEVAAHNQASDCWMVIDKDVLNVTSFVDKHPGGEVITEGCGKDATGYFNGVREHMKPFVKTLAQKMVIGKLAE